MSSTVEDLEISTYGIDRVVEGTQTGRDGTTLMVSSSQLAVGAGEPALAEATVEVVRPGESVRISNVLDVVLPSVKPADPASTFPGVLGPPAIAGTGRTGRLLDVAVIGSCDWLSPGYVIDDEFPDSIVDMAGPGADRSPFGATSNVVLRFVPTDGAPVAEVDAAIRRETLRVARDLAATTIDHEPDDVQRYAWPLPSARDDLPAIVPILQVASEGPMLDTYFQGEPMIGLDPTAFDPRTVLDGALTNGAYDWAGVRNVTAVYQDNALVRALFAGHDERFRFAGFIIALGYLDTAEEKQRSALASAALASSLGADGVICTTFSSGNSHTDTMLTVRACEAAGIATTALVCETNGGLTDHVAEADCLVSTGNEDELLEPWTPDRVIGSMNAARVGEPVPTWAYVAACVETGDATWTAVPA
ncbi:MAG TPA: glycine/sarcosine/betaine reductase component B subunit [Actinomycetota bacterium]